MHLSPITAKDSFLEPYNRKLKVSKTQHFIFQDHNKGPFWMLLSERLERKQDRFTGKKTMVLSVRELMVEIHSKMPALKMKELKN